MHLDDASAEEIQVLLTQGRQLVHTLGIKPTQRAPLDLSNDVLTRCNPVIVGVSMTVWVNYQHFSAQIEIGVKTNDKKQVAMTHLAGLIFVDIAIYRFRSVSFQRAMDQGANFQILY